MIMLHCAQLAIYCAVPRIVIKRLWEVVILNCAPIIVTIYSDNQSVLLYSSVLAPLRSLRNPPLPNRCLSRCRVCTLLRGTLGGPGKFPCPNYTGLYYHCRCSLQYRLIRWLVAIRFFMVANCFGVHPEFFWNRGPLKFLVAPMTLYCWREISFCWCQGRCTIVIKFLWDVTHTITTAIGCGRTTTDVSDFSFTCIPTVDRCDV